MTLTVEELKWLIENIDKLKPSHAAQVAQLMAKSIRQDDYIPTPSSTVIVECAIEMMKLKPELYGQNSVLVDAQKQVAANKVKDEKRDALRARIKERLAKREVRMAKVAAFKARIAKKLKERAAQKDEWIDLEEALKLRKRRAKRRG